jgi:hypothetical protein
MRTAIVAAVVRAMRRAKRVSFAVCVMLQPPR